VTSFSDDFNRPDGSVGANWVQVSGAWVIVSNRLSPGTTGSTVVLRAATAMATSDNYSQVTIAATTSASQGVWCRGDSTLTSGYAVRNNGTNWALFSVVGGTFTSIGTYAAAAVAGDVVKIQAVGSTITAYINGVSRISVTNTAVTTGTNVGIRSDVNSGLSYDNYAAGDVVTGATIGPASSSEAAQPLTGAKTATLAPATEADSTQPLTGTKAAPLAPAAEADTAQSLPGTKTAGLAPAAETDTAQNLTGVKAAALPPSGETDAGQSVAGAKVATLTPSAESDTAQGLSGAKAGTLGIAGTAESAQALTGTKSTSLTSTAEQDTAQSLTGVKADPLPAAEAVETAVPLVGTKTAALGPALEVDAAHPLTVPSTTKPSPERTYTIPVQPRRLAVPARQRRYSIPVEPRTHTIRR
jgi:hypothetical protein